MYNKKDRFLFLYKLYKKSKLVYVGVTSNMNQRIRSHSNLKDFDYYDFDLLSKKDAEKKEKEIVKLHRPCYNIIRFKNELHNKIERLHPSISNNFYSFYSNIIIELNVLYNNYAEISIVSGVSERSLSDLYNFKKLKTSTICRIISATNKKTLLHIDGIDYEYQDALSYINSINNFTNRYISINSGVSERKIIDFKNGKVIDFWLLTQYAAIIGREIIFRLY